MNKKLNQVVSLMNQWTQTHQPFVFLFDFELKKPKIWSFKELSSQKSDDLSGVSINFRNTIFAREPEQILKGYDFSSNNISLRNYRQKFNHVKHQIQLGNSFLTNLTDKTPINTSLSLSDIYRYSTAPYNFMIKGEFVSFSPEPFIMIDNNTISTFPMKGTIDANIPKAEAKIINDIKELEEHVTVVDLLRNDLSQVADNVHVQKFRYIEKLGIAENSILQISSKIRGKIKRQYKHHIGDLFIRLLPAGSVSGAPKASTQQIISSAEQEPRGYFTGVAGIFDGKNLRSAVLIRYIEYKKGQFFFRSGGGITSKSDVCDEYQEMIQKIYLPW